MPKLISIKHKDLMVEAYLAGKSAQRAADLCGYTKKACLSELKRREITRRTRNKYDCRKYKVNDLFFDKIDTEQKAYWLGFITADGCVNKNNNAVEIELQIKDIDHLKKFKLDIESTYPIHTRNTKVSAKVYFTSKKLINSLEGLGVSARKTFTVKPCEQISDNLLSHYWRGMIDADGSIHKNNQGYWYISLCGNKLMISGFRAFVYSKICKFNKITSVKNSYKVSYGGKTALFVTKIFYDNSILYLDRKKKLADELIEEMEVN